MIKYTKPGQRQHNKCKLLRFTYKTCLLFLYFPRFPIIMIISQLYHCSHCFPCKSGRLANVYFLYDRRRTWAYLELRQQNVTPRHNVKLFLLNGTETFEVFLYQERCISQQLAGSFLLCMYVKTHVILWHNTQMPDERDDVKHRYANLCEYIRRNCIDTLHISFDVHHHTWRNNRYRYSMFTNITATYPAK
jgi:hypothetical protein